MPRWSQSVAEALLDRPLDSLANIATFDGAGIYAIYYSGQFAPYRLMSERNETAFEWPVYIGKVIPSGGRKGAAIVSNISGQYLWKRLREHADSVRAATNLNLDHFRCRYLIVDDIWIPLGEALLIARFKPVWNLALDGFGNHDPGAGRYSGQRPLWDILHPGCVWAERCASRAETAEELAKRVSAFLAENPPPLEPRMSFDVPSKTQPHN